MQKILDVPLSMEVGLATAYFSLAFMLYFFSYKNKRLEGFIKNFTNESSSNMAFINSVRSLGFIFLGLVPGIIFPFLFNTSLSKYGLNFPENSHLWLWWLIPTALFLIGSIFRSSKGMDLDFYPQVRIQSWSRSALAINVLFWIIYLIGYEFAFRGYLFFPAVRAFGLWPAVLLNSSIYGLTHIPKGTGEAFGAFFLGILFCLIAYNTNSIVIPLGLHVILAVGNDIKAILTNPNMHVVP